MLPLSRRFALRSHFRDLASDLIRLILAFSQDHVSQGDYVHLLEYAI